MNADAAILPNYIAERVDFQYLARHYQQVAVVKQPCVQDASAGQGFVKMPLVRQPAKRIYEIDLVVAVADQSE